MFSDINQEERSETLVLQRPWEIDEHFYDVLVMNRNIVACGADSLVRVYPERGSPHSVDFFKHGHIPGRERENEYVSCLSAIDKIRLAALGSDGCVKIFSFVESVTVFPLRYVNVLLVCDEISPHSIMTVFSTQKDEGESTEESDEGKIISFLICGVINSENEDENEENTNNVAQLFRIDCDVKDLEGFPLKPKKITIHECKHGFIRSICQLRSNHHEFLFCDGNSVLKYHEVNGNVTNFTFSESGHEDVITNLSTFINSRINEERVISCGIDGKILVWDLSGYKICKIRDSIDPQNQFIGRSSLVIDNRYIIFGGMKGEIFSICADEIQEKTEDNKINDLTDQLNRSERHDDCIRSLKSIPIAFQSEEEQETLRNNDRKNSMFVTCSIDKSLRMWKYSYLLQKEEEEEEEENVNLEDRELLEELNGRNNDNNFQENLIDSIGKGNLIVLLILMMGTCLFCCICCVVCVFAVFGVFLLGFLLDHFHLLS